MRTVVPGSPRPWGRCFSRLTAQTGRTGCISINYLVGTLPQPLFAAAQVTESYISKLLARKRAWGGRSPPAVSEGRCPDCTRIAGTHGLRIAGIRSICDAVTRQFRQLGKNFATGRSRSLSSASNVLKGLSRKGVYRWTIARRSTGVERQGQGGRRPGDQ
jgi:hypothetical protein